MREFKGYHPIVSFSFFAFVIVYSCIFIHPVLLGMSLFCGTVYSLMTNGIKAVKFNFLYMLPMIIVMSLLNPLFNHEGLTILTYLPSGNPLTLESIYRGIATGVMVASVIIWFSCYNTVMESDKFIYLFGKAIPTLSLILSMVLRFVPQLKKDFNKVMQGQKALGNDYEEKGFIKKIKNGGKIITVMISRALENAVTTADSMKSRGYGLPGRRAYSNYKLTKRDIIALAVILVLGIFILINMIVGKTAFSYFPRSEGNVSTEVMIAYFLLLSVPIYIELWEVGKWKLLKSRI